MYHPDSNSKDKVGDRLWRVCRYRSCAERNEVPAVCLQYLQAARCLPRLLPSQPPLNAPALTGLQVWKSEEQQMEAEEVMKVINERKPEDM